MNNIIDSLNWRYATKIFDKTKKVKKADLDEIIEAFRLSSSAFGVQPWKLLVIENQKVKDSLVESSWGQSQISDCSHLLVLCRIINLDDKFVDKNLDAMVEQRGTSRENLVGYEQRVKGYLKDLGENGKEYFGTKQVFLALGNLLTVLAIKKIDSCTIGGFIPEKYDEILNLKQKGLASVIALPIGYRSEEDKYGKLKKVRFSREEVVEMI
ncbi:MAG: NAD(P)H-dependent oxidoreductase [Candidatus Gracilibacteria bacterium]